MSTVTIRNSSFMYSGLGLRCINLGSSVDEIERELFFYCPFFFTTSSPFVQHLEIVTVCSHIVSGGSSCCCLLCHVHTSIQSTWI